MGRVRVEGVQRSRRGVGMGDGGMRGGERGQMRRLGEVVMRVGMRVWVWVRVGVGVLLLLLRGEMMMGLLLLLLRRRRRLLLLVLMLMLLLLCGRVAAVVHGGVRRGRVVQDRVRVVRVMVRVRRERERELDRRDRDGHGERGRRGECILRCDGVGHGVRGGAGGGCGQVRVARGLRGGLRLHHV